MGFEKSDVSSCFQGLAVCLQFSALHAFRYVPVLEDGTLIHALRWLSLDIPHKSTLFEHSLQNWFLGV
ncbi:hypothetical protein P3S67_028713 [Capsicum chacoense]